MNQTVIFGGEINKWSFYDFQGGRITSLFGSMEVDLTDCYISADDQTIDLNVICGSVTLIVPKEWNVLIEVMPVLGCIEDEIVSLQDTYIDPAASLILKGSVIMGVLEIKRV
ncbi:MAG TPA: LiaF domain-containing protein [Cytophagales bacterium]|nr:LiaF domain-containing protein [Cytophagales bacterium]